MSSDRDLILPPVTEDNICLPLSINAVSRYWNVDLPMDKATSIAKKYPQINGSILAEGMDLAEDHGLGCIVLHSDMNGLRRIIDDGIPPIAILPGISRTVQHASVISGYDDESKTILHYIPQPNSKGEFQMGVIPEEQFDALWSEDGYIAIIIAPPEKLVNMPCSEEERQSNRLCFLSEKQNLLGDAKSAIKSLKDAIQLYSSNSTAHSLLGSILNENNSAECITHYERALEINPRSYLSFRGLGNYYIKLQSYAEAEKFYTKAISINATRYGPIYKNRAITRMNQGNKTGARKDFEAYLCNTPDALDGDSIRETLAELGAECGI
ncbi:MAG: TPR repeat protein [Cenarchaeum symbiont of Oopsacas minuta]|nr:TPR repeat protein [Cenarchaeum symbiont of Oopsacas minuta]